MILAECGFTRITGMCACDPACDPAYDTSLTDAR
ncbi:hypothetical protein FHS43_002929 [Streptosporangium becharense]|uniref:Uncharacterized protein n=1 Tax=Streptosporangium becharense TaxID=1816182 RepID=A0A7W9IKY8_9ACTN|nr:hypothetical protein [Streptosporangium becharense]MBB5822526.1 hypothetical protein [Streptosporangium becharense]